MHERSLTVEGQLQQREGGHVQRLEEDVGVHAEQLDGPGGGQGVGAQTTSVGLSCMQICAVRDLGHGQTVLYAAVGGSQPRVLGLRGLGSAGVGGERRQRDDELRATRRSGSLRG